MAAARAEGVYEPEGSPEFKKWQCGTPYQYPIPDDGDHWEKLLQPLLEKDRVQCDSWKDEVQNLLIFAGLFSAVLTAFVIVSYPSLQPDQNEVMINLLARIATRLDNPLNATSSSISEPIDPASLASPVTFSSIRINVFWFISLVLSLTTALIGIVALQWLREHQQYPSSLSSRQKFAMFNMRTEGLVTWYVPQVFSSLPLLLQLALLFFFVGLIDFLVIASSSVATPVIIFIGIPLTLLILTTTIPALQIFIFCLPLADRANRVPQQAPYKSTQSKLFCYLLSSSWHVFSLLAHSTYGIYYLFILLPSGLYSYLKLGHGLRKPDSRDAISNTVSQYESDLHFVFHEVFGILKSRSWLITDGDWLIMRDAYAKSIFDKNWWITERNRLNSFSSTTFYDLTSGIFSAVADAGVTNSTVVSLGYHTLQDLSLCINHEEASLTYERVKYNRYLQHLVNWTDLTKPSPTFSSLLPDPTVEFMEDETNFIFLSQYTAALSPCILQHFVELHIRMANYLYPSKAYPTVQIPLIDLPTYPDFMFYYHYDIQMNFRVTHARSFEGAISEQLNSFVKTYFEVIANPGIDDDTLLLSFGHKIGKIFEYAAIRQSAEDASSTLIFLSTRIKDSMEGILNQRSDFLFYISSFYACTLLVADPPI